MSSIEIKRKMMKLYRGDLLKKVYSTLLKIVTKTRIEEEGEEGEGIKSSSKIEIIQNPRESIKLAYDLIQSAEQEVPKNISFNSCISTSNTYGYNACI